jgi:hypothetical protein
MLGLGRASQYAGWWTGKPSFLSRSQVTGNQQTTWANAVSITPNSWAVPPDTRSFDNTSLTSGAKGTQVLTFKYQAQSNFTWQALEFRTQFEAIKNAAGTFDNYGPVITAYRFSTDTGNWPIAPLRTTTGQYLSIFCAYNGYDAVKLTGNIAWDSLADRWLTVIVSYSSTTSDFAGWTGGTLASGNYASRVVLLDAQTGERISLTDWTWSAFQEYPTDWANYTWGWDNSTPGSSSDANFSFGTGSSGGYFDQTDFLTGAHWVCQGQVIDPTAVVDSVPLSNYFVGQYFPETVNGVRAWTNWTPVASTTAGSDQQLTQLLPSRTSQSTDIIARQTTANLTSPYTDASKP